ncbi:MAG: restriction endonuclease subunit S [Spirochaetaceae bacterium]|nr:restriction endonuclease subunit S [Spirochaetaceae bacterium]
MGSGNLKPGWTLVAFGDVVRQVKDPVDPIAVGLERYVAGEHMDTDDLHIRRWGTVGNGYLGPAFHARFRPGHVLYGSRRTYLRKVAVADFEGVTANTTFVIETRDPNVLLPALLPFIMQTEAFHGYSIKKSKGSVNPYVNFSDIAAYEFALPPPDEQPRMAATLRECDRATQALHALVAAMRVARGSVFDTLLANSITRSVVLGSLLTEAPRNGCSAVEASTPTGHWVLGLDALTKSGYRPGRLKPVQRTAAMLNSVLEAGDLLISRSNTRDRVGLPGIFNEARFDVSWPDTMMRLRPDPSVARPHFLELFLRSASGRRQIERFAAGTSASMKKVNADAVRQLSIALPSPDTQDAMLRQVGGVMGAATSSECRQRTLKRLRSTVLSSAL